MMKKLYLVSLFSIIALICSNSIILAETGVNIHIGEDGLDIRSDEFINYYQAPREQIVWLQREKIPEDQWPLLFELARAGKVSPERVWETHRQQSNWYDVLTALGVAPSYFYYDVPNSQQLSPPYGKAYGYYKKHPTKNVRWSDADLARLASVRFITESTRRPAHEAVALYEKHPNFIKTRKIVSVDQDHSHKNKKVKKNKGNGNKKHGKK